MRAKALTIGLLVLLALVLAAPSALAVGPRNTSAPQIAGTPSVGSTLTETAGQWENAESVTMQWWQCDPTVQDGCTTQNATRLMDSTSPMYTPSPDDVGYYLFVSERAFGGGYYVFAQSNVLGPVTAPAGTVPPRNLTPPEIRGTPVVGAQLTVTTGTWDSKPGAFAYDWERCPVSDSTSGSQANCTLVGTGASYVVAAADLGKLVEAGVTALSRMGDSDEVFSKFVGPVTAGTGPVQNQRPPQVTNSGKVSVTASGKSFVVAPAVRVSCPSGGSSCSVDMLAKTKVRTTRHRKTVWQTLTLAHVHFTLRAGKTSLLTFRLTGRGASLLVRTRMLSATVTTRVTATGVAPVTRVKTVVIHRPKAVVIHRPKARRGQR
jgi:hypothetical protein